MNNRLRHIISVCVALGGLTSASVLSAGSAAGQTASSAAKLRYGDFNQWVTRHIKESAVIGGKEKTVYAIGPEQVIDGEKPYKNLGGSPWATSNVMAKVAGVVKTSNAVYPAERGTNDRCAMMTTKMESVKVLGLVNMEVMVSGSIFLGEMIEPIKSTSDPYTKMEMGVPFTSRPKALVFDYKVDMPTADTRTKSTGFSAKKTLQGRDKAMAYVILQRRWEDADGNIHARRIGTGGELYDKTTPWQNGHKIPITYGDAGSKAKDNPFLALRSNKDVARYARNSKGKMVPVIEDGWDSADAQPTHVEVMFSAGSGEAFIGTEGLTIYVDNVGFEY